MQWNPELLNPEIQSFINANLESDINRLILSGTHFSQVSTSEIVEQIEAKKRCAQKLPTWFNQKKIYYPHKLNVEQTSSEQTAEYKAELVSGDSLIDVTGGFGVDCFFFNKRLKSVTHCDLDPDLSQIAKHNFEILGATSIRSVSGDGIAEVIENEVSYDWVYSDPSRRHDSKGKVFFLKDCIPSIPDHLEHLFKKTKNILVKTSPLLDLSIGIAELQYVKSIHIVAVKNEVKELLWILNKDYVGPIGLQTANIKSDNVERFGFNLEEESTYNSNYELPKTYLYEPNAAIMKSGGFDALTQQYPLKKLHKHSHLYTSDRLIDFPGRSFKITAQIAYSKKDIKKMGITKANITTRNFSETVEQIRKKTGIKEGGSTYLFFTTNINNERIVLLCEKEQF